MSSNRASVFLASFARAVSVSAMLLGVFAIAGWVLDIIWLRSVYPGLPSTTLNDGLTMLLTGIAVWFTRPQQSYAARRAALICVGIVLAITAATFTEHLCGCDLGIDELLIAQHDPFVVTAAPGRMAPHTAVGLGLIALALAMLNRSGSAVASYSAHALGLLASLVGQLVCVGYAAAAANVYLAGRYGAMSAQVAGIMALLGFAVLCTHPDRGLMLILASPNAGGVVARRLLPLGFGVLPLLVLLSWIARVLRLGSFQFGGFIVLVMAILIFAVPILWTSVLLFRTDNKRLEAEKRLAAQYELVERLNNDLQAQASELRKLNKELETFSYSVSHDLRAPLRHITGYMELLEDRISPDLDEENKRYVRIISDASVRMRALIDDLLAFSRMARSEMLDSSIDLSVIAQKVIAELRLGTEGRVIEWTVQPLPEVDGDPSMIELVLTNLVSNALKFTAPRPAARIEIGCWFEAPDQHVVYVRDNGVGFDMKYAHKLFGVFERLHRREEFDGTGIGLATVRRIVDRHGGRVWGEAVIDQGATFYFSLPKRSMKKTAAASAAAGRG
jgi:signal transduction histidine kinase